MVRRPAKRLPDFFALPSFILFLIVVIWIGNDLLDCMLARHALVRNINKAVEMVNNQKYEAAQEILMQVENQILRVRNSPAETLWQRWREFSPELDSRFAQVYAGLGKDYVVRAESAAAVRSFTMALAYDPETTGIAKFLAQECFFAKNWELGFFATTLLKHEEPGMAAPLSRYFSRRL